MKKITIGLVIIIVLAIILAIPLKIENKDTNETSNTREIIQKEKERQEKIKNSYNEYVITNKDCNLYKYIDGKYKKIGSISNNTKLKLKNTEVIKPFYQLQNEYYFVYYEDVNITEKFKIDERYKNYIPFNENVVTKNTSTLHYLDSTYTLNESISLNLLIKKDDKYYVVFDGSLVWISISDVEGLVSNNSNSESADKMAVLNYHFFYDPNLGEKCNQPICHTTEQFESHLKYLTENNYFEPTMEEFELFIDGKIRLPKKSVLVTIDDGGMGVSNKAIPLLEKYKVQATLFLITSYWSKDNYVSNYLEIHSHSNDMHKKGVCPGGQGGGIKCLPRQSILDDLKITRDQLNTTAFAYPFYEYNDYAIELLKEAGFTMAFAGGGRKATVGMNKMIIPRYGIDKKTDINVLISMLE